MGFGLGFLILLFTRQIVGTPTYGRKIWQTLRLVAFFLRELVAANLRVAKDVLTPGLDYMRDSETVRREIKEGFERRVLEVVR